jgi:hypothetical protein
MRIYERRETEKRDTHCPTCGNIGHMWMTCPAPAKMMELKKQGKEPDINLYSQWMQNSYGRRDQDGKFIYQDRIFRTMQHQFDKQEARTADRKTRKERREQIMGKPTKRKITCGFCGGEDHNRRNCEIMFNFQDDLERASINYRKKFYHTMVKEHGFAVGAVVGLASTYMNVSGKWHDDWNGIGVVTEIDWSKVNLGLTMNDYEYRTDFPVKFLINGETHTSTSPFKEMVSLDTSKDGKRGDIASLFVRTGAGWGCSIESILAPSENLPSEEWFNEGYTNCWKWITKNKSLSDISCYLAPLIALWHPSRRGRNAGKLNHRLSQYGYKRRK